jgi:nanoRNase/pAp phosphatase (c-di-AMP/oligoRNAs hydrolase)
LTVAKQDGPNGNNTMDEPTAKPMNGKVTPSNDNNFQAVVEKKREEFPHKPFAIFTHAYPDPDAIGSMMGLNWILSKAFGIESDIFYFGEVSHPQNTAIVNLLDPQLKKVQEEYHADRYGCHILVDTTPAHAGIGDRKIEFDIVIDHHKEMLNGNFNGVFIHYKTGACGSIVFKLMKTLCQECWLEDDNANDSRVATAMMAGVLNDSDWLTSDDLTEMDFDCYNSLFEFRNPTSFKSIIFFKRPKLWTDMKAVAAQRAEIDDEGNAVVGLGLIPESQRDLIADMATEMGSWASVETAIVFALVGCDQVEGCVRSQNNSINVHDLCKKLGGRCGSGGGKLAKGAYRYSLGGMAIDPDDDEDTKKQTWELIRVREMRRISKTLKK